MRHISILLASTVVLAASAAQAQTVLNTSLTPVASRGAGSATTTTDATGTRTTVTGPSGDANRSYQARPADTWVQSAVGGDATVGITTNYARNGNGSAYFTTTDANADGAAKADLQLNFAAPVLLSSLSSVSYDWYRDASSTTGGNFAPALRFDITKDNAFAGSLVFENYYQGEISAVTNTWTRLSANLNSGDIWATNSRLGPTAANANGGEKTFQQWIDDNAGSTLRVTGLSIGMGSGWNGTFAGAVDNVAYSFTGGPSANYNFEVVEAAAAVPEPATWAMMLIGFGGIGAAMRRRKRKVTTNVAFG